MRRRPDYLLALALAGGLAIAAEPKKPAEPKARASARRLVEAGERYWNHVLQESPRLMLTVGQPVETLPEFSNAHVRVDATFGRSLLSDLKAVKEAELSHEDWLSWAVLRTKAEEIVEDQKLFPLSFPVTPYAGPFFEVHPVFAAHTFVAKPDLERYERLLAHYARMIAQIEDHLRAQADRKVVLPVPEIDLVVAMLNGLVRPPDASLFGVKAERLTALDSDADAFRRRVAATIEGRVNPALRSLAAYLSTDYRKKAPTRVGLSQYAGGLTAYRLLVKRRTTLNVTPEEVHRIGLSEVDRNNRELEALRQKTGFSGTRADFLKFLRTDARFFPRTPDEIGERLLEAQKRILPKIPSFFSRVPRAPWGIKRLEPELEGSMTFGYYDAPKAGEPEGRYRFNGSSLKDRSLLTAAALIAHELVPGHHFQINLMRENTSLPRYRRELYETAYVEGWGEYASALAGEMGMYEDPYDRAGRVLMDQFISVRLVVDTGMNALDWSRERAVAFMRQHLVESDTQIATESLRYSCDIPAQALAYKMGSLKLRDLREKAAKALGAAFDIRKFHDAILGTGALPLPLLEKHVDWWIAAQKGGAAR